MKAALALSLLALAGCAGGSDAPEDVCARQADDDPIVRELVIKGLGNPQFQVENQAQLRQARQDATRACLRSRGAAPRGGVERPRP